jgi:hypothetical protein
VIGASGEHGSRFKQKVEIKTPLCPHSPLARKGNCMGAGEEKLAVQLAV